MPLKVTQISANLLRCKLPLSVRLLAPLFLFFILLPLTVSGCTPELTLDQELSKNVRIELVDWHVSGLWVINSPVCWIRVYNYNPTPVTDITISYETYDFEGKPWIKAPIPCLMPANPRLSGPILPKTVSSNISV